jgi:hypothetical protein
MSAIALEPPPSPVVAEALLDRLLNTAHGVVMRGTSDRPQQRPHAWEEAALSTAPEREVVLAGDHAAGTVP